MSPIEQVAPGVTLETCYENRLYVWTIASLSTPVVDAWFERGKEIADNLKPGQVNYALYDLSKISLVSPYVQRKMNEFSAEYGDKLHGYGAYILSRSPFTHVLKIALKHELQRHYQHVEFKIFHQRQEGLTWLEKHLKAQISS